MTVKETLVAIRALGMTARHRDGEYRVTFPISHYLACGYSNKAARDKQEAQACYTNDSDDALDTAKAIRERHDQNERLLNAMQS